MLRVLVQSLHKVCLVHLHCVVVVAQPLADLFFQVLLLAEGLFQPGEIDRFHVLADRDLYLLDLVLQLFVFIGELLHLLREVVYLKRFEKVFVLFNLLIFILQLLVLGQRDFWFRVACVMLLC